LEAADDGTPISSVIKRSVQLWNEGFSQAGEQQAPDLFPKRSIMAATIEVSKSASGKFRVTVKEADGQSSHLVSLQADYYQRLTGGKVREEDLIIQSFQFLLRHEPKESILSEFDLSVITRYFPQYEAEIKNRLGAEPSLR
jgi:hypothetical protein